MATVISIEHLSKAYRLGQIGTGTLTYDLQLWWAKMLGKPNPLLRIGETDHGNRDGELLWALKDVSFTVEQGEVLGIIGRNGAGKSTLLKILSRVTAPTSGRIRVKGRVASLLEVGTGFHPELTGRENIYLNGAILGMSKAEVTRKFHEIVDFAEIEKFIDTPVKRYSSGMYVRLAFAVAAHLEPEILVVDEVLAVGDAAFQKKCLGKMDDVAKQGRTVLFVSHNLAAIQALCGRSTLLASGQILAQGATHDVLGKYQSIASSRGEAYLVADMPRSGDGSAHFTRIRMLDKEENITQTIPMGEELTLEINFECKRKINRPVFAIRLHTTYGANIVAWRTQDSLGEMPAVSQGGSVRLHVKNLNLLPGIYHITLGLSDGYQTLDLIEESLQMEVIAKPIYPTGKVPSSRGEVMYTLCSWSHEYV